MKRTWLVCLLAQLVVGCKGTSAESSAAGAVASVAIDASKVRDGDVIFQESTSSQSAMVSALTRSRWTHVGVIFVEPSGAVVLEAATPVRRTPLRTWIGHGRGQRYVVKRLRDSARLTPAVVADMRRVGAKWLGRPYDLRFRWDDEALYCSELVYKLFERAASARVGTLERAADMNLDDPLVQKAIKKRFGQGGLDPAETVVTPDSIFNDADLVQVVP